MRVGAQWVQSKEHLDSYDPTWLGIGYITADGGGLLLLIALILGGIGLRKSRNGGGTGLLKTSGAIATLLVAVYVVTSGRWARSRPRNAPAAALVPPLGIQSKIAQERHMALQLGDTAPDFEAETTEGRINFHEWLGDSWAVMFSHPRNFTPVCTTELGYMASIEPEFAKRGVKIIGLSVDPVGNHEQWAKDIEETQGTAPNYPLIGDSDFNVSKLYGMLPNDVSGDPTARTPADNQTVRNVFVIGPDKKVKLILVYPMTTGRNFDEVLRVVDSLQLTAKHKVATPVNWKKGDDVIIAGSVSDEAAKEQYPDGWKSPKPYIRIVPDPSAKS